MKAGKAEDPHGILVEIWKYLGEEGLVWLMDLFNVVFKTSKIPLEWIFGTIIPHYKNKCDIQDCNNYRDIKLLSHIIKLWEMVIERRLRSKDRRKTIWFRAR